MLAYLRLCPVGLTLLLLLGCVVPPNGGFPAQWPPAGAAHGGRPGLAAPAGAAPAADLAAAAPSAGPITLPPLNLPRREDWSSASCPDLTVTFSGAAQPVRTASSEAASFQEARHYRENDYYEIAECFCAKGGDLAETTRPAAEAIMAQTARQFAEMSRVRVRRTSFVEDSPLGKYSELDGTAGTQFVPATVVLRTYWRGQCSMRIATMAGAGAEMRAREFMNSLRETVPPVATAPAAQPAAGAANTLGLDARVRPRPAMLRQGPFTAVAAPPPAAGADTASGASVGGGSVPPEAASRLRQLKELRDGGLLGPEEYEAKRRAILDSL